MALTGTYDVLTIPMLFPKDTVLALLPTSVRDQTPSPLLPIPADILESLQLKDTSDSDDHVVIFQLGRQLGTGPGPMKLHFQEAKLEIPYVRHPKATDRDKFFLYKQKILFDRRLLTFGSHTISGLDSRTIAFDPPSSPASFEHGAERISYNAKGWIQVEGSLQEESPLDDSAVQTLVTLAQLPFFGDRTGDNVTLFSFDEPDPRPTPYQLRATINLGAFSYQPKGGSETQGSYVGWRMKSTFKATDTKIQKV